MQSGILLIDKPSGMSSAAVVGKIKRKFKFSKIGHAGTLDPLATGLLVCLVNSATRLASFAEKGQKVYSGTIRLGLVTTTDDIEGEIVKESTEIPSFEKIVELSSKFIGEIEQVPPQVSAIKVDGERAYKLVRQGKELSLGARKVFVENIELSASNNQNEVKFLITCSSGTYIRSIARDLGAMLGCGACISSLRREFSAPYSIQNAVELESVTLDNLLSWETLFPKTLRVELESEDAKKLASGDIKSLRKQLKQTVVANQNDQIAIYFDKASGQALGVLKNVQGMWEIGVNFERR
jgi:tRNA pseudouridine55 synthase